MALHMLFDNVLLCVYVWVGARPRFFSQGDLLLQRQEVQTRISSWVAAEAGSPDANFKLGVMYANGEGVPKDLKLAARYISIAACVICQATNWDP